MDRLSNELIELIIQQVDRRDLTKCALVNRQFHTVANPILWRQFDIRDRQTFELLQETLALDAGHGQYIQKAQFGSYNIVMTDATLTTFIRQTPNLVNFALTEAFDVTDAGMAQLVQWPRLATLLLFNSSITCLNVLPQLRELELIYCRHLRLSFLPKCLTKLEFNWSHLDQDDMDTTLAAIADLHQLTSLVLVDDYDVGACMTMTWPQLTCLYLHQCPRLTDDTAIAFIRRHPLLVDLVLNDGLFTDATLDAIATYLPGILNLGITSNTNISHLGVRRLIQRCTNLDQLYVTGNNFSVADFPELTTIDGDIEGLWELERDDIAAIRRNPIN